ncbi:hypothetical protein BH24GEM2_BH24GEM2_02910 [soil metagenome]
MRRIGEPRAEVFGADGVWRHRAEATDEDVQEMLYVRPAGPARAERSTMISG